MDRTSSGDAASSLRLCLLPLRWRRSFAPSCLSRASACAALAPMPRGPRRLPTLWTTKPTSPRCRSGLAMPTSPSPGFMTDEGCALKTARHSKSPVEQSNRIGKRSRTTVFLTLKVRARLIHVHRETKKLFHGLGLRSPGKLAQRHKIVFLSFLLIPLDAPGWFARFPRCAQESCRKKQP